MERAVPEADISRGSSRRLTGPPAPAVPLWQGRCEFNRGEAPRWRALAKPEAMKNWVMHAELKVGDAILMLSDGSPESKPAPGGTVNVALAVEPVKQDALSHALCEHAGEKQSLRLVRR